MQIHTMRRMIDVNDEQLARLVSSHNVYTERFQNQRGMETKVLIQQAEATVLDKANDLLAEFVAKFGESLCRPEYERALMELCSRVLGLCDDDRDLVTLLVKGNEVMAGAAWQNRVGPYDAAIDEYGPDENIEGSEA